MVPPSTLTALPELQEKVTGRAVPYPTRSRCRRAPPARNRNHHQNRAHQPRRNQSDDAHPERRLTSGQLGAVRPAAGDGEASGAGRWSAVFGEAERAAVAEGADSGSARRFALFAEVRRHLMEAARPSGLVLGLDDLQWADEASAALLTDVVRQLRGTPILVFATYRDSAAPGDMSAG